MLSVIGDSPFKLVLLKHLKFLSSHHFALYTSVFEFTKGVDLLGKPNYNGY